MQFHASDWRGACCSEPIGKVARRVSLRVCFLSQAVAARGSRGGNSAALTWTISGAHGQPLGQGKITLRLSAMINSSLELFDTGLTKTEHEAPEETRRRQYVKKRVQGWANNAFRDGLTEEFDYAL